MHVTLTHHAEPMEPPVKTFTPSGYPTHFSLNTNLSVIVKALIAIATPHSASSIHASAAGRLITINPSYSLRFYTSPKTMTAAVKRACLGVACTNVEVILKCPTCLKLGQESYFCSQDCFKKSWVRIFHSLGLSMLPRGSPTHTYTHPLGGVVKYPSLYRKTFHSHATFMAQIPYWPVFTSRNQSLPHFSFLNLQRKSFKNDH